MDVPLQRLGGHSDDDENTRPPPRLWGRGGCGDSRWNSPAKLKAIYSLMMAMGEGGARGLVRAMGDLGLTRGVDRRGTRGEELPVVSRRSAQLQGGACTGVLLPTLVTDFTGHQPRAMCRSVPCRRGTSSGTNCVLRPTQ